jgi:hypothetical protein
VASITSSGSVPGPSKSHIMSLCDPMGKRVTFWNLIVILLILDDKTHHKNQDEGRNISHR